MSTMNKEKLKGLQSFLKDDIWRVTEDEVSKSRGILAVKALPKGALVEIESIAVR